MIPIGRYPIVKHIMDIYGRHGCHEFVLCLGHLGWRIKEYFLNFQAESCDVAIDLGRGGTVEYLGNGGLPPWRIILADTGIEAMTGCRVKRVQKYIGDETFMLTYGDGVGNVDVSRLIDFHRSHGRLATITSVRPPSRFGHMEVSGDRVVAFREKHQSGGGLINGGFFVCEPGVFDYLTDEESCVFERTPLERLAADGQLMTFVHDGFWMPMDTSREYLLLNDLWNRGDAPWLESPPEAGAS